MMTSAISREAMASMIACRLDPFLEKRMTSLNVMMSERVFAAGQLPQFPTRAQRTCDPVIGHSGLTNMYVTI